MVKELSKLFTIHSFQVGERDHLNPCPNHLLVLEQETRACKIQHQTATHECVRHCMDAPSLSSQPPSLDLGPEFDAPTPTATASTITSPYDPMCDTRPNVRVRQRQSRLIVHFTHRCDEWMRSGRSARRPRTTAIQVR